MLFRSISSVQSLSHVKLFATPWTAAHQVSLSITNSWSLLKLMSIESVIEIRPSSIAANPVESQEASPSSIVSLTSQRHPETLPEVTGLGAPWMSVPTLAHPLPYPMTFHPPDIPSGSGHLLRAEELEYSISQWFPEQACTHIM